MLFVWEQSEQDIDINKLAKSKWQKQKDWKVS